MPIWMQGGLWGLLAGGGHDTLTTPSVPCPDDDHGRYKKP